MTGRELRDEGWAAVEAADCAVHRGAGDHIREAITALMAAGEPFDAEDVRKRLPGDVQLTSVNLIGAILGGLSRAGRLVPVGEHHATRASRRYGRIRVWVGAPVKEAAA